MNIAVILSSGIGKRMGAGENKVFLELAGKPLIYHTIKIFQEAQEIDGIVVTSRKEERSRIDKLVERYNFFKTRRAIVGGKERQDSSRAGLKFVVDDFKTKDDDIILFHNGANPFFTEKEIEGVIAGAKKHGAAAVAHRTKDTIKRVSDEGRVVRTLERAGLWNMQTPQAIKMDLAVRAFKKAEEDNFLGTDDISLVENLGEKPLVIEASDNNFKITTPIDLKLAEIIIKEKDDQNRLGQR